MDRLGLVLQPRDRVPRARGDDEARRCLVHVIAVAHPDLRLLAGREAGEHPLRLLHLHHRASVLAPPATDHLPTGDVRDPVETVADAEERCDIEDAAIEIWRPVVGHRVRPAAQDDPGGLPVLDPLQRLVGRMDLGVDTRLAHPARDELRELGAAVEDQDTRGHGTEREVRTASAGRRASGIRRACCRGRARPPSARRGSTHRPRPD